MPNNNRIPRGYRNETNLPKRNSIYLGMVRANFDAQRMGRLLVWISDFGPDDPDFWIPMSYATPFAGATPVNETRKDGATMADSQQTYGWWATPPDRDNQVLCCFLDGDIANGYWFACVYPQNMNHMIPGIGSDVSTDPSMDSQFAGGPPVVEYNKYDSGNSPVTSNTLNSQREQVKRPVFTPLAEALIAQGLTQDVVRGAGNTSARRESPSRVHGFLSPRGNGWVVDDGALPEGGGEPENEFIRFRTRNGVQIVINDTDGFIYMITKGGKSWVEIGDTGIDMWSAESISMASEKNVNISAGGNIGLHGNKAIYMASAFMSTFTDGDTNIVANGNIYMDATRDIGLKSSRDVSFDSVRDVTSNAGRNILNGACGVITRNAKNILDNSGGAAPPDVPHAKFERNAVSRLPTHEPFDRDSSIAQTGTDKNGNPTRTVRRADGTTVDSPLPPVNVSDDDIDWLTTCMIDEAGNQSAEGKAAVAQVIRNRLASPSFSRQVNSKWTGRLKGIILAPNQFSGFYFEMVNGKYTRVVQSSDSVGAERRGQQKMARYMKRADWDSTKAIAQAVVAGTYSTGSGYTAVKNQRADMYYNPAISSPAWARTCTFVCTIGGHKFMKQA